MDRQQNSVIRETEESDAIIHSGKDLKKYFLEQFLPYEWPQRYLCYDLLLTFFSSALFSLKTTTVLKPYPSDYYDHDLQEVQRDKLIKVFEKISGPINRLMNGQLNDKIDLNRDAAKLVHWILSKGTFDLKLVKLEDIDSKAREIIDENFEEQKFRLRPNFVFEIIQPKNRPKTRTFAALRAKYGSFFAFHGSPMENFHSILHNGLIYSLNKRSMLGVGTYLSSRIEVAILFSPFGQNYFKGSRLGKKLSCLAMCEVIDHPDIEAKKKKDTYYVVSNDELIRIAYLLLYSSDSATHNLHHLNVSSIPFGKPDTIETTTTSNLAFIIILVLFFFIGFFISKSPDP